MDYQVGGTLPPSNPYYVEREADNKLFQSLTKGEFCYVFNSRQTGKSSLQVHVRKKLEAQGIICAYIDLSSIDTNTNIESWYLTIIDEISASLLPEIDIFDWWDEIPNQNILAKFSKFFREVLLQEIQEKIIIFIDEIDTVLSLKFSTDDFFRFIRSCYNKRALKSAYQRLTFCLLGVTDPSYLINNKENTPFNIGTAIELRGFTFAEAQKPLIKGIKQQLENPETVLKEILAWTNGQPFLTIKLLHLLKEKNTNSRPNISEVIQTYVIENWESQDHPEHLKTIRDRLLFQKHLSQKILILYQDILHNINKNKRIKADDSDRQDAKIELLLSGLIIKKNGYLVVNNKIYEHIFNLNWIKQELTKLLSEQRPRWYVEKITLWLNSNRQDKSVLLTPEELINFQQWTSDDRSLNKEDLGFLYRSIKQIETKTQKAKQEALQAKLKVTKEKKRAYKIVAILAGLTVLIIISIFGFVWYQIKQEKLNQIADKLVKGAELESHHNLQLSTLLYAEALKHKPSIFLKLDFYEKLALLSPLKEQFLHQDHVNSCQLPKDSNLSNVAFSSSGDFFVTASLDEIAKLWNTSKMLRHLQGNLTDKCSYLVKSIEHNSTITALAISADHKYLATASNNKKLRIFEQNTGQLIILPLVHQAHILALEFSPDGQYLITGDLEGMVKVWNISTGETVATLKLKSGINDIAFSPQEEFVAVASYTGVRLWNFINNQSKRLNHNFNTFSVNFSPDGNHLAVGSADNTARVWNISQIWQSQTDDSEKIDSLTENKIFAHQSKVNGLKFSPDGQYLLTSSDDNTGKLWSLESGKLITQTFHQAPIIDVAFLNTGQIATVSWDYTVRIWDHLAHRAVKSIQSDQVWQNLFFNLENNSLATQDTQNNLKIWDLNTGTLDSLISLGISSTQNIDSIYLSPQGNYVGIINDNQVLLWKKKINEAQWERIETLVHPDNVHQLMIDSNENYLITLGDDSKLRMWNLKDAIKFENAQIVKKNKHIKTAVFTPDNKYLAVIKNYKKKQSLSLQKLTVSANNTQTKEIKVPEELTNNKSIIFAQNQPLFATINNQNNLCIWNSNKLKKIKCKLLNKDLYNLLQFSSDGNYFATVKDKKILHIWQSSTLKQELTIPHEDNIKELRLSSDGKYIATITVKNQIQVWQIDRCQSTLTKLSCQPVLNFLGQDNIQEIVFTNYSENNYLAIALPQNIIQIRLANLTDFVNQEICPLLNRNLSKKEWRKHIGNESYSPTCSFKE